MKHCDLLVTHGLVVDAHDGVREDAALAVKGNRLVEVGPSSELSSRYDAERSLDASGKVVLPGLINAHTHASAGLFRGYASDVSGKGFFDRMKGLWNYFAQGFRNSEAPRKRIQKARTVEHYREAAAAFWDAGLGWVP